MIIEHIKLIRDGDSENSELDKLVNINKCLWIM